MLSNAEMAENHRISIDLEIAQKRLEIERLRLLKRQVNLTERLGTLHEEKHRTDYEIEVARLKRNIARVEYDIANIDVKLAERRTEQKLIDETIQEDLVQDLLGGLIPVVVSAPKGKSNVLADILSGAFTQKGGSANPLFGGPFASLFDGFPPEGPAFPDADFFHRG